jgi:hypothetical protein
MLDFRRRELVALLGDAAAAWLLVVCAHLPAMPLATEFFGMTRSSASTYEAPL